MAKKFKFDFGKAKDEIKSNEKKKFQKDPRFWKPTVDEKGNATAIIRFIPDMNGEIHARVYGHNFTYMRDGVKKYWIKNCVNTFGYDRECPICKKNQEYWNSSFEADKKIASQRKRKLTYTSNIVVLKNPANPEDEGKVFLYEYGVKIFEKIKDKMFPSDEMKALGEGMYDEFVPFDLYEGANFKLVQVKQGDFPNYDKSTFDTQRPLGTDEVIEKYMNMTYDLSEFTADDKFPTNDEVISTLGPILGLSSVGTEAGSNTSSDAGDDIQDVTSPSLDELFKGDDLPDSLAQKTQEAEPAQEPDTAAEPSGDADGDSDPDADFFKNLQ